MNTLDKQYTDLLQDILDNGVQKGDRTGTGTISVFGRQIRHKMSEGFPLITTKKMPWKTMVTELLWFLRGDTNIKYLVDNNCHIWDGDAYKNYLIEDAKVLPNMSKEKMTEMGFRLTQEEFINKIKTDNEFAKRWGELGPIYGKQWREWKQFIPYNVTEENCQVAVKVTDQIANLINDLKTNPDSRRLMVNAWNVGEIDQMVLPPCHYGFQVYTRELSYFERYKLADIQGYEEYGKRFGGWYLLDENKESNINDWDIKNIPTRAISLMWNQRSVDTFLGLPFNIASYGLLLLMIADEVNMVPDELIGNLGDTHLYLNHIEQAKEQIGRELSLEERHQLALPIWKKKYGPLADMMVMTNVDNTPYNIPTRTREPYPLPTVYVRDGTFCSSYGDVILENYQSHPAIKAPLSN
jgi:thymidylate synthase